MDAKALENIFQDGCLPGPPRGGSRDSSKDERLFGGEFTPTQAPSVSALPEPTTHLVDDGRGTVIQGTYREWLAQENPSETEWKINNLMRGEEQRIREEIEQWCSYSHSTQREKDFLLSSLTTKPSVASPSADFQIASASLLVVRQTAGQTVMQTDFLPGFSECDLGPSVVSFKVVPRWDFSAEALRKGRLKLLNSHGVFGPFTLTAEGSQLVVVRTPVEKADITLTNVRWGYLEVGSGIVRVASGSQGQTTLVVTKSSLKSTDFA